MLKRWASASVLAIIAFSVLSPAAAGLSRREVGEVGFHLVPGATLPGSAALRDQAGASTTLAQALDGKPALVVFTDYRCESLCGIILDQLAGTLPQVGLALRRDYNVISLALDAAQTPADATAFRDAHTSGTPLRDGGLFFTNDAPALAALKASVGLVAPFDVEHRQFAHPAGLVLVDAQGRAQRVLSPLAVNPVDLKLALTDGGAAPLSLTAHALLLCYGFNPEAGVYTVRVERVLMAGAATTIAVLVLAVTGLFYRERRGARP